MSENITNELIYEVLKSIRNDMTLIRNKMDDHSHQLIKIREDIHELRGDDLRRETLQAQMDERIEARLSLNDPTH
jgi:hypothetical protein